jgi:hypothetical protein
MGIALLLSLFCSVSSYADTATVLVQSQKGSASVDRLKLETEVEIEEKSYRIRGSFEQGGWQLIVDKKIPVEIDEKSRFEILHPKDSPGGLEFELTAISPSGKVQSNLVQIKVKTLLANPSGETTGDFNFRAGLSLTSIDYSQSDSQNLYQLGPTLKGSARYVLVPDEWDLGASAYVSLFPITSSLAGSRLYFYGLNVRGGYRLPIPEYPEWVVTLAGGLYTLSTIGRADFGYSGVFGPQIYPYAKYTFSSGEKLGGYLKFSPVATSVAALRFDSNEFAFGFDFTPVPPKTGFFADYPISYVMDFSFLNLKSGSLTASGQTIGAGAMLAF